MSSHWEMPDVTGALERGGYQRAADCGDGRVWYIFPDGEPTVERYVVLEPKTKLGIYSVYFGFSNADLRRVRAELASSVAAEIGKKLNKFAPCWTTFDVGRPLNWPLLGIPYPREQAAARVQFSAMCQYLQGVLDPIDGPAAVLDRLLRVDSPFDWISLNHPVRRAVEAVAAASVVGQGLGAAKERLFAAQPYLYQSLRTGSRWPRLIDTLATYAEALPKRA